MLPSSNLYSPRRNNQRLRQELALGLASLVSLFLVGTLWYHWAEGWSWSDAAYMTTITLSTVGFGEVEPLSERSRIFTVGLILTGIVSIGYIVNRFTEALIGGYFQQGLMRRQQRQLVQTLSQHYIVCGFGRTGRQVALEFQAEKIPFIVIEADPEQVTAAQEAGFVAFQGDATLDESLYGAQIEKALCIVAALASDADNLYTILSAKTLNPEIRAIARASTEEAVQKLQRAGADGVVSPYITGGRRLAAAALRPQVMDFVDGILTGTDRSFYMEEFLIDPKICPSVGQTLSEARLRSQSGALVLAIRRVDGTLIGGPMGDTILQAGDLLICMGTAEQLRELSQILLPIDPRDLRLPKIK
ncbi:MAG: potassium channel protein [Cyanobacteria bacterium P01_H01_bin.15]